MSLLQQLQQDLKEAMRSKEEPRLTTIRSLMAAIKNEESAKRAQERTQALHRLAKERGVPIEEIPSSDLPEGQSLTDEEMRRIVQREVKQRQDAAEAFRKGDRPESAAAEEAEIVVLKSYLPQQMSADELRPLIQAVIQEVGATGKADMKKVMPVVIQRYKDRADGRTLNQLVQELLS